MNFRNSTVEFIKDAKCFFTALLKIHVLYLLHSFKIKHAACAYVGKQRMREAGVWLPW